MNRTTLILFVIGCLPMLSGCLPFIWASPPMKAELGAALRNDGVDNQLDGTFPMRLQVHPLQVLPRHKDRSFDLGLGWQFLPATTAPITHGPVLEAGWLSADQPLSIGDGESLTLRFGANLKGAWVMPVPSELDDGWMAGAQGTIEWVRFASGPFEGCDLADTDYDPYDPPPPSESPYEPDPNYDDDDEPTLTCASGWAEGEGGIGFFVEGAYGHMPQGDLTWIGGGLIFRIPASVGVGFATLF